MRTFLTYLIAAVIFLALALAAVFAGAWVLTSLVPLLVANPGHFWAWAGIITLFLLLVNIGAGRKS